MYIIGKKIQANFEESKSFLRSGIRVASFKICIEQEHYWQFIRRVERKMQLAVVEQRRQRGGKALVTVGQTVTYVVWLAPGTGVSDFILLEEGD